MVSAASVVHRYKLARLPAGSSWHEVTDQDGHRWVATVMDDDKKWIFLVKTIGDGLTAKFEFQIGVPTGNTTKFFRWPKLFIRSKEALREAEIWAKSAYNKASMILTGFRPV
jgi:hypothetical protein